VAQRDGEKDLNHPSSILDCGYSGEKKGLQQEVKDASNTAVGILVIGNLSSGR
jgi:hypothetical protein